MSEDRPPRRVLPALVAAQLAGTSLWFAGNAVLPELQRAWGAGAGAVGAMTTAVQLGFILGTLAFAFFNLADRFSPRRVFTAFALLGALVNGLSIWVAASPTAFAACRFGVGVTLAGVYPVGMKIAAGWYRAGLGLALGYLVGALCVGTAAPHLVRALGAGPPAPWVLGAASALAALGAALVALLVPDGPHHKPAARFDPRAFGAIFAAPGFRAAAGGYFGHMWELYAFWAFVPVVIAAHGAARGTPVDASFWAFVVIAAGGVGCAAGGHLAARLGSARVAAGNLALSGACCVLSPLAFHAPTPAFLAFLTAWGVVVVGDSPQFSTLTARCAPPALVGSAVAIAVSLGFAITIASIQLTAWLAPRVPPAWLLVPLALGPAAGLWRLRRLPAEAP